MQDLLEKRERRLKVKEKGFDSSTIYDDDMII